MLGLYLHVPFCQAICHYCNFNRGLLDVPLKERYVRALTTEIERAGDGRRVDTIFFGGGTPSLLTPAEVGRILAACQRSYDVATDLEVTLETNPESATEDRLTGFLNAGVNRVSFGVQSFRNEELGRLGRIHTAEGAIAAVRLARALGFVNISLDLMCWLPGQSSASWRESVAQAIALEPDHVSFYLLELYPNAPLKETMARLAPAPASGRSGDAAWAQLDDDAAADLYLEGMSFFDAAGFVQYEISNSARPGHESRHNLKYWTMGSWRGFGCGAHSTVDARRWHNVASTADYVDRMESDRPVALDVQQMSLVEQGEEAIFTGLRLSVGIDVDQIAARYGLQLWEAYGENLAAWLDEGLMWKRGSRVGLTRRGMLVSNDVLATFV